MWGGQDYGGVGVAGAGWAWLVVSGRGSRRRDGARERPSELCASGVKGFGDQRFSGQMLAGHLSSPGDVQSAQQRASLPLHPAVRARWGPSENWV